MIKPLVFSWGCLEHLLFAKRLFLSRFRVFTCSTLKRYLASRETHIMHPESVTSRLPSLLGGEGAFTLSLVDNKYITIHTHSAVHIPASFTLAFSHFASLVFPLNIMTIEQPKVAKHVVAIPYPAQGHINPLLQLCNQLVPHGFTFTFVNTHHIHQRLHSANQDADAHDSQHANCLSHINDEVNTHLPVINDHVCPVQEDDSTRKQQLMFTEAHAANDEAMGSPQANGHAHAINTHHLGGRHDDGTLYREAKHLDTQGHQKQKGRHAIHMVHVEGGCAPEEHARLSTAVEGFKAAQTMKEAVEQLISNIMEEQPVAFILTDILLGWSDATASKFGLPWVGFWAASAATCSALIHLADLGQQGKRVPIADKQDAEVPTIDGIPGLPPTRLHDVPKGWDDTGNLHYEFLKYFHDAQKARFLLLNTFAEVEGQVVQAMISKGYVTLGVGPLLPSRYIVRRPDTAPVGCKEDDGVLCRASLFREDRSCLQWLDKQAPSSVLFISFGSISARTDEQLEELAHAVEASGCPFLWVRKPDISAGFTPESGRQHRAGNGLIVPWAPQLDVLAHPAVGGFVTHCGWNSVMESVAMGVPMLCWADTGERMSNQRFVVQFWKCGLDMVSDGRRYSQHIDEGAVLVKRDEIEKSIRCLMLEEAGAPIRIRATHLRHSALTAFDDAHIQFDHFQQAM
ncbi:hypothetical protein GOP47_0023286 [Adiantum capillus-veneris]|uniref:Glycosyltransferase N-terminal domain-containing protein n=1 Tax=Adiantum capillus-veneris TaxID=13818 RepID=A0A9D4U7G4_ADICA|nr:hypothetical protein GOP47_0023286 [Adiantum capillus-veneris]